MSNLSAAPIAVGADETTRQLTQIWQELLGMESVGADQNYFDLGGDSSLAVQLFARIEKTFHVKLPLATLFEAPTIEELARILQQEARAVEPSGWRPLVAIQPSGTRPALFCMHGAGGNVLIYRDLSRYLGAEQPFYGLQAQGLDGSCAPLTTIEEMAALYAKEIRRFQPHGPYFIGGYCMGGTLAYEVARQLQAAGEKIALLALFDTMDWSQVKLPGMWGKAYHELERLFFHAANFLRLDGEGRGKFFGEKVEALRNRLPVWRGMLLAKFSKRRDAADAQSLAMGQIWQANDRACVIYRPQRFAGTVTDFRPMKQYRMFHRPDVKWERLAEGGERVVVLPVYPAGMLVDPFVKHLADALKIAIDQAMLSEKS
ncbi:MAG TPA: thioesterase domain-containing protein [Candidatus Acidoferrum sp.]|nr:thioesterase domain-containing protein [Candidatus Acidoferrum sp.]